MADSRHAWFLNQILRHRAALHRSLRKLMAGAKDGEGLIQETRRRIGPLPKLQAVDSRGLQWQ
jgi:hypothetical protein